MEGHRDLPPDVLALIAQAGGLEGMKRMRGVNKSWREGFELCVRGITIARVYHPVLPSVVEAARRFPGLNMLDLGNSITSIAWLEDLHILPKLDSLVLGNKNSFHALPNSLARCLTHAGMATFQV